jgi:ribosomal protein S18 acetylase RimI-like enzyme
MSEFIIRAAVPDDAQQMAEVIAAGREQTYGLDPYSRDYRNFVTNWRGEAGARTMENYMNARHEWDFIGTVPRAVVVARPDDPTVVGVMATRKQHAHGEEAVDLDFIFVEPREQGKGLGRLLMDNLTEYAGGLRQELDVVSHNHRARSLYEKYGFVAVPGAVSGYPLQFQKMVKPATRP